MRTIDEILQKTNYNKNQLELFLSECYFDFVYFAQHALGFKIAPYHEEWYDLLERFPRLSLQAFRGSGKTNFMAAYLIWKAIFKAGTNVLVVSGTFEQSKIVLKIIRDMIMDNEVLKDFAPEDRKLSWRATELELKNRSIFYSKTYGEGVRGLRIDYVLCDEAGQYEDKTLFWTVISPVVQLNRGRIIVIGTPKSAIDLLNELDDNDEYYSAKYPAEREGKPLWHQMYTTTPEDTFGRRSLVKVRRELGELAYQQEFLLIPISSANAVFPMQMVMASLNGNKTFIKYGKKDVRYYVGVDLAVSEEGDFNSYTVMSANSDGKILEYAERFKGGINQQTERLRNIWNEFKPVKILVDKTGLGEQIFREFKSEIPAVEPFHFTAEAKHDLIMSLRREFELGRITLPNKMEDSETYQYTQNLIKELQDFQIKADLSRKTKIKFSSGKYDDCAISLGLANKATENQCGTVSINFLD